MDLLRLWALARPGHQSRQEPRAFRVSKRTERTERTLGISSLRTGRPLPRAMLRASRLSEAGKPLREKRNPPLSCAGRMSPPPEGGGDDAVEADQDQSLQPVGLAVEDDDRADDCRQEEHDHE